MKQLLLRVPDELHRRLDERARQEHRSLQALAIELLDSSVGAREPSRRERLRARAAATGLATVPDPLTTPRSRAIELTRGWGATL